MEPKERVLRLLRNDVGKASEGAATGQAYFVSPTDQVWKPHISAEGFESYVRVVGDPKLNGNAAGLGGRYTRGPIVQRDFACTDLGNSYAFADMHGGHFHYVLAQRLWLRWDGRRWSRDEIGAAKRAAAEVARENLRLSGEIKDDDKRKKAAGWAASSMSAPKINAALELAGVHEELVLTPDQLDADPWLLSCANGTLDLRSGALRDPNPADLISLGNDVRYDPKAECPRWQRFLVEVFDGDAELTEFVQRAIGYSLTGDTREHKLFVLHGSGRNGKTTLIEIVKRLLGKDAAKPTPFDTFIRTRNDGPRNDIAALHRVRLAVASESGEGRKLDEATVKLVTGGDTIAARFLFKEYFEFTPQFKIWLVTNNRPRVDGSDDAIWARLCLVPFETSFLGREDKTLPAKLQTELPGILAWAVRGCLTWQKDGLGSAAAVTKATAAYREEEDVVGAFLAERCELTGETAPAELREAYEAFCRELGEKPLGAAPLGKRLARRGIERSGRGKTYQGVSLC